ncbi:DUF1992 domain-containing protein [Modestobacter sp. VKM Ac-2977]|uniref:DnaJ family domain-containing protein n=1 Tax=Modestobacter sp. VKM Ac-2977 TaxID=3004131 RepID=UPI0022AAE290|nr:DUF1992 domain-containing protein [Modestobacter sp. VKM Ac-2977]MCZ2821287.1 DUF1992 domain-containing protein [Modestobacter sp. VKM Ac-2977]
MTERKPEGVSFESWVEHQITQARERGDLEGLAGAGKPLPRRDREKTTYEWALEWARREEADVAAIMPTGLALRKEREELPARVARQPTEELARAVVEAHVARVDRYYRQPVEGPWIAVGMPDVEEMVAEWRLTRPVVVPGPAVSEPVPSHRRRRWLRRRAA